MLLRAVKHSLFILLTLCSSACVFIPGNHHYTGPRERPPELEVMYPKGKLLGFTEQVMDEAPKYTVKLIKIETDLGPIRIDYFQRRKQNQNLVFVFPVLGGKNMFERYFASYFARKGYDAAIVHRNADFKDPENFDRIEEVMRAGISRDRTAMDFFATHYGKKDFGSFGISRGAMNAVMTAGVDPRLRVNVLVLGGSHLSQIVRDSDERGIDRYRKAIMQARHITESEFHHTLDDMLETDPKGLAPYVDGRNTLMVLAMFDNTVPLKYGQRLRRKLGRPETVYIPTGHFTSLFYTNFLRVLTPIEDYCLFPFNLMETQALAFYDKKFDRRSMRFRELPYWLLKLPARALGSLYDSIFYRGERKKPADPLAF